jgi:molecular chaperone GrpE (heat shock protein)
MDGTDLFDITERERPLRFTQPIAPRAELWHVLRAHGKARDADRQQVRNQIGRHQERLARLAGELADSVHQLRGLTRSLDSSIHSGLDVIATIADKQEAALRRAGIRLIDPAGAEFDEDLAACVEILHAEAVTGLDRPVVTETVRPGVLLETGQLARPAQVIIHVPETAQNEGDRRPQ